MILVTGASGFVGARLVEVLRLGRGERVRGLVHEPSHAVRLTRLDVELVHGDLDDESSLGAALEGCTAVVHCAYGTSGSPRRRRALTGRAAIRLAGLARRAGVARFVQLSSVAVWGFSPGARRLDESVATPRRVGHPYCDGKLDAERGIQAELQRGLPAVVLRPTNVWGPWSRAFTEGPVRALRRGEVGLVGDGSGPSNTIYVDNLVAAILRALDVPGAIGGTFVVDDENGLSWRDLYCAYAEMSRSWIRTATPLEYKRAVRRPPARVLREFVAERPTLRRLAHAAVDVLPAGVAAGSVGAAFSPGVPPAELVALQTSGASFRADRARAVLGWRPVVEVEQALDLTKRWLRFAGLV